MARATLRLTRGEVEVQQRPFEILLDGTVVGTNARHQTHELLVEPGNHTLRVRSGRQVSAERSFNAAEGEVINFSCHGARIWPIYVASLIKPDLGISLKQDSEPPRSGARWASLGRWIPSLYIGFASALLPWVMYLAVSLPRRSVSEHYRGTWVLFDAALILVIARIGWLAHRRNPQVILTAAAGSALLLVDAWFDVTTAAPGSAHIQAVLSAVFLELPAAVLCGLLAQRGLHVLVSRAAAPANVQSPK